MIEHLDRTRLSADAVPVMAVRMRMRMPLLFFYDGPDLMYEGEREELKHTDGGPKLSPNPGIGGFAFPRN